MKKKLEIILLLLILVLGIYLRTFFVQYEYNFDPDTAYHYSMIERSIEQGGPKKFNELDMCYNKNTRAHPKGYYWLPYHLGKDYYKLTPVFFWTLGTIFFYLFIRKIFNVRVALLSISILSFALANIQRSMIGTFRGDNMLIPFLFLSLFLVLKKNKLSLTLSGIISTIPMLIWNGGALSVLIADLALLIQIFSRRKRTGIYYYFLFAQLLSIITIQFTTKLIGKNELFANLYPFLIVIPIILVNEYFRSDLDDFSKFALKGLGIGSLIFALIKFKANLLELLKSFRIVEVNPLYSVIQETGKVSLQNLWIGYWILSLLIIVGIVHYYKHIKSQLFLSILIPSIVLLMFGKRFIFFTSYAFTVIIALTLAYYIRTKNKKPIIEITLFAISLYTFYLLIDLNKYILFIALVYFISLRTLKFRKTNVLFLITILFFFSYFNTFNFLGQLIDRDTIEAIDIYGNVNGRSCLISTWDLGGEVQLRTNKNTYTSSVGGQYDKRIIESTRYFLTSQEENFNIRNSYILVNYKMLDIIEPQARLVGIDLPFYTITYESPFRIDVQEIDGKINLKNPIRMGSIDMSNVKKIFINDSVHYNQNGKGCIIYQNSGTIHYINDYLCDSNMIKMLMKENITNTSLYFSNTRARLYKVENRANEISN